MVIRIAIKIEGYRCEKCGHIHNDDFEKCPSCGWPYDEPTAYIGNIAPRALYT